MNKEIKPKGFVLMLPLKIVKLFLFTGTAWLHMEKIKSKYAEFVCCSTSTLIKFEINKILGA